MRQVADKSNLVFAEIFNALGVLGEKIASSKFLYSSAKLSDARRQIVELESLLQKEKAEVEVCHATCLIAMSRALKDLLWISSV